MNEIKGRTSALFVAIRSNFTINNLDIMSRYILCNNYFLDEHEVENENDQFLYAWDIQYGAIIFNSDEPLNFYLLNTQMRTEYLSFGIQIINDCSLKSNYANYGEVIMQNSSLSGGKIFEQKRPYITFFTNNNLTVDNCTFNAFSRNSDANQILYQQHSVDSCKVPVNDGRTKYQQFTNILIKQETSERSIQNQFFIQYMKGGDRLRNFVYLTENITIENVFTTNSVLYIGTLLPNITVSNVFIRNSTLRMKAGSFLNITVPTKIVLNNSLSLVDEKIDSQLIIKVSGTPNQAIQEYQNLLFENNKLFANVAINSDRDSKIIIRNSTFKNECNYFILS
ncbi:UNKNOWN [Stylonychia lemnae]|uniref:Right handed beta helix domain-containing protein n=1 Tax=Stylonychia lemnae TaxID=5949 RepID=A0A077ZW96_STYLE|nr:UNKNOWN [Stylonychia lemnae]|eukprot:CDW74144.1 UNKNOWN [Stylonychia lemnae]